MKRSYLIAIALLVMVLSIVMIVGGSRKSPLISFSVTFPDQILLSSGKIYQVPPYEIKVSMPSPLIMGTISHVNVDVHPLATSTDTEFPLFLEVDQVDLESRLDITDAQIAPSGLIRTSFKKDSDSKFTWNLTTDQSSSLAGTLWVYLAVQPTAAGTSIEEIPLLAVPMDIHVSSVLGLRADLALVLGIFGILFSFALWIVAFRLNYFKQKTKKAK